jgi:arsenate reductase
MVPLPRRAFAEFLGTAMLVAAIVGSGIAAQRLSPGDVGLQLLENSVATAFALMALILAFAAVSGAHFNPAVTLAGLVGTKGNRREPGREATVYVGAQVVGGCLGAVLANVMFDLRAIEVGSADRLSAPALLSEVVATFGLLMVIIGVVRAGRVWAVPFAVAGYIGAAYWFTSSTSFANPAVTVARTLTDSFTGISPGSAAAFVIAQLLGAALAVACARIVFVDAEIEEVIDA